MLVPQASFSQQRITLERAVQEAANHSTLAASGRAPFHLLAIASEERQHDPQWNAQIEEWWQSPTLWRREIRSQNFTQTLVVNGTQVYEQDSATFFPEWLRNLAVELVDPVPAGELDRIRGLHDEIAKPGGGRGQVNASWTIQGSDGKTSKTIGAGLAFFNDSGLLMYGDDINWDFDFHDYKEFHGQQIARTISAGSPEVTAKISILEDLNGPDPKLFSIETPTPSAHQIQSLVIPEMELRKLVVTAPEPHWPDMSAGALTGAMVMRVVVDREGKVQTIDSFVSDNQGFEQTAREQLKAWRFQPYLEHGVPVQVISTLTFPFSVGKLSADGKVEHFDSARNDFDRARAIGDLRSPGASPFHMKATFDALGTAPLTGQGVYEETWLSPTQWRREATLGDTHVIEARNGNDHYLERPAKITPRRIDDVFDGMWGGAPATDPFYEGDWREQYADIGSAHLLLVVNGPLSPEGRPDAMHSRLFYFDPANGALRLSFQSNRAIIYDNLQPFGSKLASREITEQERGEITVRVHVGSIEPPTPSLSADFVLPLGIHDVIQDEDEGGGVITPPTLLNEGRPTLSDEVRAKHLHGTVVVAVELDAHGHVRYASVMQSAGPDLNAAALAAAYNSDFQPGTFRGRPWGGGPIKMTFKF